MSHTDDERCNGLDPVLRDEILHPRHAGALRRVDGRGVVVDAGGGNAVRIALQVQGSVIVQAAFRAFGDVVLRGCSSVACDVVMGQSLRFAAHLREAALAFTLRLLPSQLWCAALVLEALADAIDDCLARQRRARVRKPPVPCSGVRRRRLPSPTAADRRMLRPGETAASLMRERAVIMNTLHKLAHLPEVGASAHHLRRDISWREREDLICDRVDLKQATDCLCPPDQQLIAAVGLHGLTEGGAAAALGISQQAVNRRLWGTARRLHCMLRARKA